MKVNTHGIKIRNLKKVSGETIDNSAGYSQISYDTATGELLECWHAGTPMTSWSVYHDPSVITIVNTSVHMTMQQLADAVWARLNNLPGDALPEKLGNPRRDAPEAAPEKESVELTLEQANEVTGRNDSGLVFRNTGITTLPANLHVEGKIYPESLQCASSRQGLDSLVKQQQKAAPDRPGPATVPAKMPVLER